MWKVYIRHTSRPVLAHTRVRVDGRKFGNQVVSKVRSECLGLSLPSLAVLVNVLADAFSINEVGDGLVAFPSADGNVDFTCYAAVVLA